MRFAVTPLGLTPFVPFRGLDYPAGCVTEVNLCFESHSKKSHNKNPGVKKFGERPLVRGKPTPQKEEPPRVKPADFQIITSMLVKSYHLGLVVTSGVSHDNKTP